MIAPELVAALQAEREATVRRLDALDAVLAMYVPAPASAPPQAVGAPTKARAARKLARGNGSPSKVGTPPKDSQAAIILAAMKPGQDYAIAELVESTGIDGRILGQAMWHLNETERVQRVDRGVYRKP